MRKSKRLILILSFLLLVTISICAAVFIINRSEGGFHGLSESSGGVAEEFDSPFGFFRIQGSLKHIQFGKDYIYFHGETNGIFKYDYLTGEVSSVCVDPLCSHSGDDATCRLLKTNPINFFRMFPDMLVYSSMKSGRVSGQSSDVKPSMYVYDLVKMTHTLIDEDAAMNNQYCISERYLYYHNIEVKDNKNYYNFKQVDMLTGDIRIFGDATESSPQYRLIGAYAGKLYATDPEETVTYVSDEKTPGEFKKIWDRRMAFIFTDGKELFFKSKDPENMNSDTYYFYHTDFEGNVKSKHELNGGMYWGGLHDGRHLYYVPQEKITIVLPDGSEQETHPRYMYKLDIETGEQTVAFEFSGDYSLMYLGQSGNDLMVYDNKIYTYDLCGYVPKDDGEGYDMLNLKRGLVVIDMENGDITYITAELDGTDPQHPTITNIETIPMDLANEKS